MIILATKSSKVGSKIIRWGLGSPASHIAIYFDHMPFVWHSHFKGIQKVSRAGFFQGNEVVAGVRLPMTVSQDMTAALEFSKAIPTDNSYDFPAFAYFCYAAIKSKLTSTNLPPFNPYNTPDGFLCTEVLYIAN